MLTRYSKVIFVLIYPLILALTFSSHAAIKQQHLLSISSQIDENIYPLYIIYNDEGLLNIEVGPGHISGRSLGDGEYKHPGHGQSREALAKILRKGMVLSKKGRKKIVILKSRKIDFLTGGKFKLSYLSNGLFGQYKTFHMVLEKNTEEQWQIVKIDKRDRKTILKNLHFSVSYFFGLPLGIKKISINKNL